MDPPLRIVTKMPLGELWRNDGCLITARGKALSVAGIRSLLRAGAIEFVVAEAGQSLKWVPVANCTEFWKSEVKLHVADPGARARLDDFQEEYCYFASQWHDPTSEVPIVLLERNH